MTARLLWLVVAAGCASAPPPRLAPALAARHVVDASGAPVDLLALAAGRPLVVEVLASWCDVCRRQSATVHELASRPGGTALVVGVDVGEDPREAAPRLARWRVAIPIYFDPELRFASAQGVTDLPTLLVFDAGGRLRHAGRAVDDAARAAVDAALLD